MTYLLMFVSTTLTLKQGHGGSSKGKNLELNYFRQPSNFFYATLTLETFIWLDHLVLFLISTPFCTGLPLFLVSRCSWLAVVPG